MPVEVTPVVDDPADIRRIARESGPYYMPARYLIDGAAAADASTGKRRRGEVPAYLIGPVWRGDWAFGGDVLVEGTDYLLHHEGFAAAAREMTGAEIVVPEQVFANLGGPSRGSAFSHVDIPEFVGTNRTNAPGWLLQAMGSSRLFEDERITIVTAVSWFHQGERGFFRYWPEGRDGESVRHERMWNTSVVGDNDFMHHQVERVGPDGAAPIDGLTIDTHLDHDGDDWIVVDDGEVIGRYTEDELRISVSWKAKVYADAETKRASDAGQGALTVDQILARFDTQFEDGLAATSLDAPELRDQLSGRYSGYRTE